MQEQTIGKQSIKFLSPPNIISGASVVGKKEGNGPLGEFFDEIVDNPLYETDNWETAESKFQQRALEIAMKKAGIVTDNIRYIFSGDLLGQLIATTFGLRPLGIPLFGLYGACSTMGEGLALASMAIAGGYTKEQSEYVAAITSSHFASAEKTFRFPLGYGSQRKFSATWTVTGSGAVILGAKEGFAKIIGITVGKIVDYGLKDKENMGACMAPAAADTIYNCLRDFGVKPNYFDKIVTGDLGIVGQRILIDILKEKGFDISDVHMDCGIEIFDCKKQDTHSGGSGCGCSAVTLCSYLFDILEKKEINRIMFVPTGALLSVTSSNEGESVPGIAHAIIIEGS